MFFIVIMGSPTLLQRDAAAGNVSAQGFRRTECDKGYRSAAPDRSCCTGRYSGSARAKFR